MGKTESELGMSVQHPTEDQMGCRDGRIERISKQIKEEKLLRALAPDHLNGMEENGETEFLNPREYRLKERIIEVTMIYVGTYIYAAHARQLACPVELIQGAFRVRHWQS